MRDLRETDVIETEERKTQTGVNEGESAGAVIGGDQIADVPRTFTELL
jgi:hypothetical protein